MAIEDAIGLLLLGLIVLAVGMLAIRLRDRVKIQRSHVMLITIIVVLLMAVVSLSRVITGLFSAVLLLGALVVLLTYGSLRRK